MKVAALSLLFLLGLSWAIRLLATKAVIGAGLPIIVTVNLASLGVVVLLTALNMLRRNLPPVTKATFRFYVVAGAFGFAAPFFLEVTVAGRLPAVVFVLIVTSAPIWTAVFALLSGLERVTPRRAVGIALGFAASGLVIVGSAQASDLEGAFTLTTLTLAFAIPVFYASYVLFIASKWPRGVDGLQVAQGQAVVALLGFAVAAAISSRGTVFIPNLAQSIFLGLIIVSETVALVLFFYLARREGGTFASQANYIAIAAGALLGSIFFGEDLHTLVVFGVVLLCAAIFLNRTTESRN